MRRLSPIPTHGPRRLRDETASRNVCVDMMTMMWKSMEGCALLARCHPDATLAATQSVAKALHQGAGIKTQTSITANLMNLHNAQIL